MHARVWTAELCGAAECVCVCEAAECEKRSCVVWTAELCLSLREGVEVVGSKPVACGIVVVR